MCHLFPVSVPLLLSFFSGKLTAATSLSQAIGLPHRLSLLIRHCITASPIELSCALTQQLTGSSVTSAPLPRIERPRVERGSMYASSSDMKICHPPTFDEAG